MRVYYRGPEAVVTSEYFVWRGSTTKTFTIRDMRNACVARQEGDGPVRYLVATIAAFLLVTAAATAWTSRWWTAPLIASPVFVAGLVFWQRRPATWRLEADHRGQTETLFTSADARVFNQVSRALQRAIEEDRNAPRRDAA